MLFSRTNNDVISDVEASQGIQYNGLKRVTEDISVIFFSFHHQKLIFN